MPLDDTLHQMLNNNFNNALETTVKMLLENIEDKLLDSSRQGYNYAILFDENHLDKQIWFENPIKMYVDGGLRNYFDSVIQAPYWIILKDDQLRLCWRIS